MESLSIVEIDENKCAEMKRYNTTTISKLQMLAEQIEHLQQTARNIIHVTDINRKLHLAECNFSKVMGNSYHFYERENGSLYCSLIAPHEWVLYHKFVGSYIYDFDSEFKPI